MTTGTIHVVGAGLAGLSAATSLAEAGRKVVLYEAAKSAGGRCRSYFDSSLGLEIDNGNHLLLSGNRSAMAYLRRIGGERSLDGPDEAAFAFADTQTGERWLLRLNEGRLPWWVLAPGRRVPGTSLRDYMAPLALLRADPDATIAAAMTARGRLWERLWRPVFLAVMNTEPESAAVGPAVKVLRESLGAGGAACRPLIATKGLSAAFVEPALGILLERRAQQRFGARLRAIESEAGSVRRLIFTEGAVPIGPADGVVLAVPPWVATELLPEVPAPTDFRAIVNAHFAVAPPPGQPLILGLIGSLSEWLFAYPGRLSVTISAADRLLDVSREELAATIWREVAAVTGLPADPMPPWQIVKERRATFAATPAMEARRPATRTSLDNLALAGDWVSTGLPATIEGAVRSGEMAAAAMLQRSDGVPCSAMAKTAS